MMNAIVKNIPNSITCLNLLSGCFACIFAFQGQYDWVALCIGLSALFDFLDGMAARLLHAYSPLGKELDSLADLISFGLAPGLMVMHLMAYNSTFHGMAEYQSWWALSALLIPVFSALRLAKFNIDTRQTTSFIGLPVPANALFWIGICQAVLRMESPVCGYAIVALVIIFSLLLVSEIPMFSLKFKNLKWKENYLRYLIIAVAAICLISLGLAGLAATIGLYIVLSLLTARKR
ncbi:MAG TPA: CDP-diacylglycerol--serine O-phosphatidyltransferase [Candidatus Barnesiella merdigallinarum]|uniref:CDP-diacylglycerol--serine O-phosphatidyltransferase n=1 Tax=uncultured Barnesiella sp. TaxID=584861 RepID=UPI001F94C150|nr:CDP-diacylglycerol--serine O-phosphatidyltransferase [uncultured Barnesiella sp.]HJB71741.1 CDP-diacylglycerol--serine O-phosphatidyltransferase [Candidatus Barnesiella merdigallinarum]